MASIIENVARSQVLDESYHYIYFNHMNLALKSSLKKKAPPPPQPLPWSHTLVARPLTYVVFTPPPQFIHPSAMLRWSTGQPSHLSSARPQGTIVGSPPNALSSTDIAEVMSFVEAIHSDFSTSPDLREVRRAARRWFRDPGPARVCGGVVCTLCTRRCLL